LINFGVPGIAGERAAPLQPIMSNKFRLVFYDFGDPGIAAPYVVTQQVRSAQMPTLTMNQQTLYAYVSIIYIATRAEWGELSIRFLDDITSGVYTFCMQQMSKQQNMFDQTTSRAGENYKFEMDMDVLAGGATAGASSNDPNILRRFSFAGCFMTSLEGSEMAYQTPDGIEFGMKMRFDNCVAFDNRGVRIGTFNDEPQIANRIGISTTGIGAAAGSGVNGEGNSINVRSF